ncbi:MAG: DNA cytosine methyltransferase [Syntrophales bacterium]
MISAVDLFCGAGGLTKGLENAGIEVRLGIDVDPACEFPYTANNKSKFLRKSVEDVPPCEINAAFRKGCLRLLAGCAPCQTFSTYNQKATPEDKRWWLLRQFSRLILETTPELITMENVPRLRKQAVFQEFVEALEGAQYYVTHDVVNCDDYGVPQHRQRVVLLASRLGPVHLFTPTEFGATRITVRRAIGDLAPLEAGEISTSDPMHRASMLSKINLKRIEASRPGGSWRDWQEDLVAKCHRKRSGKTYPSVYGRMSWSESAPTITTQFFGFGNGRFGHPEQNRAISLREGAILQSFPKDYRFAPPDEPIYIKSVGRLIGNAVPPVLGEVIGRSVLAHVLNYPNAMENAHLGARSHA